MLAILLDVSGDGRIDDFLMGGTTLECLLREVECCLSSCRDFMSSASLLLLITNLGVCGLELWESIAALALQPKFQVRSTSSLASHKRQSEKRRNSRSRGVELRSAWKRGPRFMNMRPGSMSWIGRPFVERWRASSERIWAWVCSDVFKEVVTEQI